MACDDIYEIESVACPGCGRPAGRPCSDGYVHKWRREAAIAAGVIQAAPKCSCRNHRGGPKVQHKTESAAVAWVVRNRTDGMRYEVYRCPDIDRWHVRTARG